MKLLCFQFYIIYSILCQVIYIQYLSINLGGMAHNYLFVQKYFSDNFVMCRTLLYN
jgi:hypothetical protein